MGAKRCNMIPATEAATTTTEAATAGAEAVSIAALAVSNTTQRDAKRCNATQAAAASPTRVPDAQRHRRD